MSYLSRRRFAKLGVSTILAQPLLRAATEEPGSRTLGIALLGLGKYSTDQLAPAITKAPNARLAGIVTGSPKKIPTWRKKHGIPESNVYSYENFDKISGNDDIDIVYVVTPTALHPEFAIRAAEAGKHVISEKPMAPDVEGCTRMIDAAKANNVTLQMGYRLHWEPHHIRLIEAMKSKEFGEWKSIDAKFSARMKDFTGHNAWRISKELGVGGSLYDLGVYAVQGTLYSARELPKRVTAKSWSKRKDRFSEVPEYWEWEFEFPSGRKATGSSSYGDSGNYLRIETEKGELSIEPAYGYGRQSGKTPDGAMNFPDINQQALQIEGQVESILNKTASMVPGEMGRRDIRVIRGIVESAKSGKPFDYGDFDYSFPDMP